MSQDTDTTRIVDTVEDAESTTSAEFVVAIEPSSRSYRDVDLLFAIGLSFAALLFAFFGPVLVAPDWLPLNLSILFAASWVLNEIQQDEEYIG